MAELLKRLGLVVWGTIGGAITVTLGAFVFGLLKGLVSGGGGIGFGSAAIFGVGLGGAVGAICGAMMGADAAKEKRRRRAPKGAEAAIWTVAVIIALICVSVLFGA